jgi:hypothetical protein
MKIGLISMGFIGLLYLTPSEVINMVLGDAILTGSLAMVSNLAMRGSSG